MPAFWWTKYVNYLLRQLTWHWSGLRKFLWFYLLIKFWVKGNTYLQWKGSNKLLGSKNILRCFGCFQSVYEFNEFELQFLTGGTKLLLRAREVLSSFILTINFIAEGYHILYWDAILLLNGINKLGTLKLYTSSFCWVVCNNTKLFTKS